MAGSLRWALLIPLAWWRWRVARIGDTRPGTLRFSPTVRSAIRLLPGGAAGAGGPAVIGLFGPLIPSIEPLAYWEV